MLVYLLKNTRNGKCYVGATTRSLRVRWNEHLYEMRRGRSGNGLYSDMRTFGPGTFEIRALSVALNREVLGQLEAFWTRELSTRTPEGYNETDGGRGTPGREVSPEERAATVRRNLGRIDRPETTLKRRLSHLGNTNATGNKGKKKSPEHRRKLIAVLNSPKAVAARAARRRRNAVA